MLQYSYMSHNDISQISPKFHPLSDRDVGFGLWWLAYGAYVRFACIGFFALLGIVLWTKAIWGFVVYVQSEQTINAQVAEIAGPRIDYLGWRARHGVIDLITTPYTTVKAGNRKMIVWSVINANTEWQATIEMPLLFDADGGNQFVLLPGQKWWFRFADTGNEPQLFIKWKRLNKDEKEKLGRPIFLARDMIFQPEIGLASSRTKLVVENQSVYGWWNAMVSVVAMYQGKPIAVGETRIEQFLPLTTRDAMVSWAENQIVPGAQFEAIIIVNPLDEASYMPSEGGGLEL